jgi:uncharacterized Zn finger protein (UPF0148 family)
MLQRQPTHGENTCAVPLFEKDGAQRCGRCVVPSQCRHTATVAHTRNHHVKATPAGNVRVQGQYRSHTTLPRGRASNNVLRAVQPYHASPRAANATRKQPRTSSPPSACSADRTPCRCQRLHNVYLQARQQWAALFEA